MLVEPATTPKLTPRQLQILELLAQGYTHDEIARQLYLSTRTVKAFSGQARKSLGARNSTHAVVLAHRLGLLDPCAL